LLKYASDKWEKANEWAKEKLISHSIIINQLIKERNKKLNINLLDFDGNIS
jgi:hypothetical protein